MEIAVASTTRAWFGQMYDSAVRTLDRNIFHDERGAYIRAGDGYTDPWTRDAALNSWGAASLLRPDIAKATLLRVCDDFDDGSRVIAQDDQWWDQVVWVIAARDLALTIGDREFLRVVLEVGSASLEILHRDRFRPRWGLYAGPALMQDGISGLPTPPATSEEPSSFVLDYPDAHEVMTLSTNVLYVAAYRALDATARDLGDDPGEFASAADRLTSAIRDHLADGTSFGYFRHGAGALTDTLDQHREAAGLALAVLFGVAPTHTSAATLDSVGRGPAGVVNVAPHFSDRYSDDHPGRHNAICWPMVMGLVGSASASVHDVAGVDRTLEDLRALVEASDGRFDEVYDAVTGAPSGGWQCGFLWDSEPNQTWSATSFLRLVHHGVLGLRVGIDGVRLEPLRPAAGDIVTARGITVGTVVLDITVEAGEASSVLVDGVDVTYAATHVRGDAVGRRTVHVVVGR